MSLSIASSAVSHGKVYGYNLAGLSTVAAAGADVPRRPGVALSWSWAPTSTGSGRRDALMAVLAQVPIPAPDDLSGSSPAFGGPRDATSLLISLNDRRATPTAPAVASAIESPQPIDRLPSQHEAQAMPSDGTVLSSSSASSETQPSADDSAAVAEVKLEALFKTLQAYGL